VKETSQRGSVILAMALGAVAAADFYWGYLPDRRRVAQQWRDVESKREFVLRNGSLAAAISAAQEEQQRTVAYTAIWQQKTPGRSKLPALFTQISDLAKHAGTTTRFDPEPAVRGETCSEVSLRIGVTGRFGDVVGMLEGMEKLAAPMWVEAMRVDTAAKDGQDVRAELDLVIFANNSEDSDYAKPASGPIN